MTKKNNAIAITSIISGIILIIALVALLTLKPVNAQTNTVNVQGLAEVKSMPDLVGIYFNIETNANTSSEAKELNDEIFNKLVTSLVVLGLERKDIVTESFSVYEEYDWNKEGRDLVGYRASHRISVKLDIEDSSVMDEVIDEGVNAGALVSYINFELTQESQNKYKAEAMKLAAEDARIKAESVAEGFNKRVGKLVSVQVNDFGYYPWRLYETASYEVEDASVAKNTVVNIQPGEEEITASVSAVFRLR